MKGVGFKFKLSVINWNKLEKFEPLRKWSKSKIFGPHPRDTDTDFDAEADADDVENRREIFSSVLSRRPIQQVSTGRIRALLKSIY